MLKHSFFHSFSWFNHFIVITSVVLLSPQAISQTAAQAKNPATTAVISSPKTKTLEQELEDNKNKIVKLKKQMTTQKSQASEAMKTLQSVESELNSMTQSLKETEQVIALQEKELDSLKNAMNTVNKHFQEKMGQVGSQMKAAYLVKRNTPVKLFLSQKNPHHIDRLMQYYRYLEKHHFEVLSSLLNELHTLSVQQSEVDAMNVKIKELKEQKLVFMNELRSQKQAQQKTLEAIKQDVAQTQLALTVSEQNDKALTSQLEKIQTALVTTPHKTGFTFFKPSPFSKAEGKLLWPIRKDPRSSLMSPFIIQAPEGETVHATFDGHVVFADLLRGFGLLMIIDHGEGYLSLYGHNQILYKNVGERVKRGDMVARVGTSGELNNSGLYFEVRKNGKQTNLVNWFK